MSAEVAPGWVTRPLDEVLDFREGPGIMARDFRDEGVPLLRLAGLKREAALLTGCNYLDPEAVDARWSQFRLCPGDVLLSTSASLGEVAVVDDSAAGSVPYTGIIRFRPRDDRVLPGFIQYALRAPSFKRQIEAVGVGSVMRHFGPMHLRQMTIDIPPHRDQAAIAEVLGALDDKIHWNSRLVASCEALALAHVRGLPGQRALSNFAIVRRENVKPEQFAAELVEHYSLPAFDEGRLPERSLGNSIKSNKFLVARPSVLVSKLNPHIRRVWYADPSPACMAVASTEFVVLEPMGQLEPSLLWAACAVQSFCAALAENVTGTTGSHQRVKPQDVLDAPVADVTNASRSLSDLIDGLVKRALAARRETAELFHLQDLLLPPLISGELPVKEAESMVGETE